MGDDVCWLTRNMNFMELYMLLLYTPSTFVTKMKILHILPVLNLSLCQNRDIMIVETTDWFTVSVDTVYWLIALMDYCRYSTVMYPSWEVWFSTQINIFLYKIVLNAIIIGKIHILLRTIDKLYTVHDKWSHVIVAFSM